MLEIELNFPESQIGSIFANLSSTSFFGKAHEPSLGLGATLLYTHHLAHKITNIRTDNVFENLMGFIEPIETIL